MTPEEQALCERLPAYAKESRDAGLEDADLFQWERDCEQAAALIRKLADENEKLARALVAAHSCVPTHIQVQIDLLHTDALKIARER